MKYKSFKPLREPNVTTIVRQPGIVDTLITKIGVGLKNGMLEHEAKECIETAMKVGRFPPQSEEFCKLADFYQNRFGERLVYVE